MITDVNKLVDDSHETADLGYCAIGCFMLRIATTMLGSALTLSALTT